MERVRNSHRAPAMTTDPTVRASAANAASAAWVQRRIAAAAEAPRVVLYGRSELGARAAEALRPGFAVERTVEWRAFECALPRSRCGVAVIESLDHAGEFGQLRLLKERAVRHPLILITRRDPESLRLLKDITLEEVIWPSELNQVLLVAVQRACGNSLFSHIADDIQGMACLQPRVRAALALACGAAIPFTSVGALAEAARCDRRTLWRAWAIRPPTRTALRLEDLVGWILLIRAASMKSSGRGWSAIASEFNVSQRRLLRLSERLAGLSLSRLAVLGPDHLYRRFRDEVLCGPE